MRTWASLGVVAVVLGVTVPVGAQGGAGSASKPDYQGTAVIVALHPPPSTLHATRPVVVLHHDPIVGLMDERMEMPFIAASTELFKGLRPGTRVAFALKVTEDALLVIGLRPLPAR